MKKLIKYLLLILLLPVVHSCSSEKRLMRAINNHGIEKSVAYMENSYPFFFKKKDTTIVITQIITDTIIVSGGVPIDSVFTLPKDGTEVFLENENLKIEIENLNGKLKVIGKCKDKIVYKTDTVRLKVPCPGIICPDLPIRKEDKSWLSWFIGALGLILFLVMLLIHLIVKK